MVVQTPPEADAEPTADDVEDMLYFNMPEEFAEDELFIESLSGEYDDADFSSGVTFEQIGTAIDVARGKEVERENIDMAVDVINKLRGTDFYQYIVGFATTDFAIGKLIDDSLSRGSLVDTIENRNRSKKIADFDMSRYE